jgi:hypothetical protein
MALFRISSDGLFVRNEAVLKQSGVAQSTWSEEQNRLIAMGLIEKKAAKIINLNNVSKIMNYRLTQRGKVAALNLANISRLLLSKNEWNGKGVPESDFSLAEEQASSTTTGEQSPQFPNEQFDDIIRESIEVALDSYGINLVKLVKTTLAFDEDVPVWSDVPSKTDRLVRVLVSLFGPEGARTIETMINSNILSRIKPDSSEATPAGNRGNGEGEIDSLHDLVANLRIRINERQERQNVSELNVAPANQEYVTKSKS